MHVLFGARRLVFVLTCAVCALWAHGAASAQDTTATGARELKPGVTLLDSGNGPDLTCTKIERFPHDSFQESGALIIGPPVVELEMAPGSTVDRCISVGNRQGKTIRVKLSTIDAEASTDPETVVQFTEGTEYGLSSWIKLSTTSIDLEPGDDVRIPYTITVPKDPPVGSNYGGIRVTGQAVTQGQVGAQPELIKQVIVTTPGEIVRDGNVDDMRSPRLIQHGSFAAFEVVWKNTGNTTDHISGTIKLESSLGGKDVRSLEMDGSGRVLRGGRRGMRVVWNDPPWIGRFTPKLELRTDGKDQNLTLPAVWVIPPLWFVGLLLVSIVVPLAIRWWRGRSDWRQYLDDEYDDDEHY